MYENDYKKINYLKEVSLKSKIYLRMYQLPTNDVTVNDQFTKNGNVIVTLNNKMKHRKSDIL